MALFNIKFGTGVNYPDFSITEEWGDDIALNTENLLEAINYTLENNINGLFETDKDPEIILKQLKSLQVPPVGSKGARYELEFDCPDGLDVDLHGEAVKTAKVKDGKGIITGKLVHGCPADVDCNGQQANAGSQTTQLGCIDPDDRDIFAGAKQPPTTPPPIGGLLPNGQPKFASLREGISRDSCVPHAIWWKPFPAGKGPSPSIKFRIKELETITYQMAYVLRLNISLKIECKKSGERFDILVPAFIEKRDAGATNPLTYMPVLEYIFLLSDPDDKSTYSQLKWSHTVNSTSNLTRTFARSGRTAGGSWTNLFSFVPNAGQPTPREIIDSMHIDANWTTVYDEPSPPKFRWTVLNSDNFAIETHNNPIVTTGATIADEALALADAQAKYPDQDVSSVDNPRLFLDTVNGYYAKTDTLVSKLNKLVKNFISARIVQLGSTILNELSQYKDFYTIANPGVDIDSVIELLQKCETTITVDGFSAGNELAENILPDDYPNNGVGIFLYKQNYRYAMEITPRVTSVEEIIEIFKSTK